MKDSPTLNSEPFNIGRASYRLFFDFGVMLSCFSNSSNMRVLDFGAGTGWISEFLNRMGYEVYSLDIDPGMPGSIRSRVQADKRVNSDRITPILGSGMDLPFKDNFFSHVCFFDTLHHMNDYPKTFSELFRVLSPGGRAVFIEPGARHSRSEETIKYLQTYKKNDPTWIERDVNLDEIAEISLKNGFSDLIMQPTLLPGLKSYSATAWNKFRHGDFSLTTDYFNQLKDFNFNEHLSFYCEKPKAKGLGSINPRIESGSQAINAPLSGLQIAVDLTPMLPGAENGGAKLMTLELIRAMADLLPQTNFLLLTADASHAELEGLEVEFENIQRMCVLQSAISSPSAPIMETSLKVKVKDQLKAIGRRVLPSRVKHLVKKVLNRTPSISGSSRLLTQIGADLLFCPFTAPFYADGKTPLVSVIYDLQYRTYPQFFSTEELYLREEAFKNACKKAGHLVAISKYVQNTVMEASGLSDQQVSAVTIGLFRDPQENVNDETTRSLFSKYNLAQGEYLIFPANFWDHKNHAMLLTAFNIYKNNRSDSKLKLVCTGAPGSSAEKFCQQVQQMGLSDSVIYPGYVSPNEYDCLIKNSFALIFPSLYEGFGIPVLEAMAAGVPVLCSNVTSLPEVGGDAVLYFDPRKPVEIVNVIDRLVQEPGLRESLVSKGLQQSRTFEGPKRMAQDYLAIFSRLMLPQINLKKYSVTGIYKDGWTADTVRVEFPATEIGDSQTLLVTLDNPHWKKTAVTLQIACNGNPINESKILKAGRKFRLSLPLPQVGGIIEMNISPTFNPARMGLSSDSRELGLRCILCELAGRTGKHNLLEQR